MTINGLSGGMPLPPARTDIDGVLAQIRAMRAQTQLDTARIGQVPDAASSTPAQGVGSTGFSDKLRSALDGVSALQKDAAAKSEAFASGRSNDLVGTMLAMQKSDVAFQATMQVRNRMVSAYQDIMNMPI